MARLNEVEIHRLRPTQMTVGMIEVHDQRNQLEALRKHDQRDFMEAHPIPAVWARTTSCISPAITTWAVRRPRPRPDKS
jgi:hypothetical protein